MTPLLALILIACAGTISAAVLQWTMPLMRRYALARPNARSSHKEPTPQGGGIGILAGALSAIAIAAVVMPDITDTLHWLIPVLGGSLALACVGAMDDIAPLPAFPRLVIQFAAALCLLLALPEGARALPEWIPLWLERGILVVGTVWFVNLTNFMDGIDWITFVEFFPLLGFMVVLALAGEMPPAAGVLAAALLGALIGFAPFNRHVARLFLGDVGSLPLGLIVSWLLIVLAATGNLCAALIVPLYYLADATVTLARRFMRGEKLSEAHRSHFYQRATQNGYTVPEVTTDVLVLNCILIVLAALSIVGNSLIADLVLLVMAGLAVSIVLWRFERGKGG